MKNIVEIKNLNFKYDDSIIFNNFNLKIRENSFTCIAGNNTSGKTTLIKLISGELPTDNTITIGYSYLNSNRLYDHCTEIGVMFGDRLNAFLFDDVYKEMAFSLENLNINPKEIENRIIELAKFFNISNLLDKKTIDLTNNEKQIILIVIALLHRPKILLLDSPFTMMDNNTKKRIINRLKEYKKKYNLTIILTTADLDDTLEADYLYVINKGNVVLEGKVLSVMKEDTLLKKLGLSLPFMVDLSLKFMFYEILSDIELDMEMMVDTLWK